MTEGGFHLGFRHMKTLTILGALTKPFNAHHELSKLMSMGFLPFLAPLAGAIGSGIGALGSAAGGLLGGLGGAAGGLLKGGAGLLGKGIGGLGKMLGGQGGGGLLGNLFKGGKQIYGGLDTLTGGLLPGGQSPFTQGGLFGAFSKQPPVGTGTVLAPPTGGANMIPPMFQEGAGTVLAPTPDVASQIAGQGGGGLLSKFGGIIDKGKELKGIYDESGIPDVIKAHGAIKGKLQSMQPQAQPVELPPMFRSGTVLPNQQPIRNTTFGHFGGY